MANIVGKVTAYFYLYRQIEIALAGFGCLGSTPLVATPVRLFADYLFSSSMYFSTFAGKKNKKYHTRTFRKTTFGLVKANSDVNLAIVKSFQKNFFSKIFIFCRHCTDFIFTRFRRVAELHR